jgi:hypothetical protein
MGRGGNQDGSIGINNASIPRSQAIPVGPYISEVLSQAIEKVSADEQRHKIIKADHQISTQVKNDSGEWLEITIGQQISRSPVFA